MSFYLYLVTAYLVGSIPFGLLIARLWGIGDIRAHGSGNIGATNVWRVAGPAAAGVVFLADIGKGAVAVLMARAVVQTSWPLDLQTASLAAGSAAVAGHTFSIYLGFRGGKGVNTALGVFVSLLPRETAIALGVFALVLAVTRYVSLGSICAAICLLIVILAEKLWLHNPINPVIVAVTTVVVILIIYTHRGNIRRLREGTEHRFMFRREAA